MLKVQQCVTADRMPKRKPYICDICYKQFETPSKLARHYLIHTGQKPFECKICHKTFRQLVHLERHRLTHNLPFQCIICCRNFKNLITFENHQRLHNENCQKDTKPAENAVKSEQEGVSCVTFKCSMCFKYFATEERWMLHQCLKADHLRGARRRKKTHTCASCNKTFPSRSKLERHFLIHTGQKPFKCSSCDKSFRQSTHLKIHQLTHTEERPFQCCLCPKRFKIQSKLVKHKQLHAKNEAFPNRLYKAKALKYRRPQKILEAKRSSFENVYTGESQENDPHDAHSIYIVPFQCPACEQCFETEQLLNLHKCCYSKNGKSSNNGATSCNHPASMKNKILRKLKHTGGKATDFPLTERKNRKLGHFKSPDLAAARDQRSDRHTSAFKDCHSKLDMHKTLRNRVERTFSVPLAWQEHQQPHDSGIHFKGMLGGGSMLNTDDSVDNEGDVLFGSSNDGFSASAKNIHNRHKVYKCDRCEKTFPSSSKLQRHYLIHTGQKPFGCNVCGKTFRQSSHLKRHQLTHTAKRPSKSSVCQVDFENVKKLSNHQEDNNEFKSLVPVVYSGYSQTASQASGFQEFQLILSNQAAKSKIKTEDFVLDTSSRETRPYLHSKLLEMEQSCYSDWRGSSEGTEESEIANKLFKCSICSKTFTSYSKLERHYLIHAG